MTRARRASRPRFRLLPTVLLTLAILGVPTVVYAWGRNSSSFDIQTVTVAGAHLVPDKRALKLLRQDYLGRNLFTVTGKDVRGTLQPLSFVAGAKVDRDFPATLAVTISEYRPAVYALAGDRWYVVDESGYVVCTAAEAAVQLSGGKKPVADASASTSPSASSSPSTAASPDAAAADGLTTATPTPGATATAGGDASTSDASVTGRLVAGPDQAPLALPRIAVSGRVREGAVLTDKAAAEMLGVITALPTSLRRSLAVVEDDGGQLTLRFADGPVAVWGDSSRTLAKTVALRTVLAKYAEMGKTCTQLDVSIPDRTLAKPVLQ